MQQPEEQSATPHEREITVQTLLRATKLSVGKNEHLPHYLRRITHLALNGDASRTSSISLSTDRANDANSTCIRHIQNLHHCPNLKVLYLYDNQVEAIENLEGVPQLTHLHLQSNRVRRIENLTPLQRLEKLYLEKNAITRLEGLSACAGLQELHLANQAVPTGLLFSFEQESMIALASSLKVLDLSNCRVADTEPLRVLYGLEQLDLSRNLVSQLEDVFALVGALSALRELDLRGNPVVATPKYREKTITFSTSRLALLDKKDVDPNQRRMMQSHLAHKYRKRLEPQRSKASANQRDRGDTASSEATRLLKHGSSVHQLRSKQLAATPGTKTYLKLQCEREGLGVAGSHCRPSSTALVWTSSSSNNKHR